MNYCVLKPLKTIALLLLFFAVVPLLYGQSRSSLESKRKQLNEQIKNTGNLLDKTSKSKQSTIQELKTLQTQVESRESLIKVIQEEMSQINDQSVRNEEAVLAQEEDLQKLKANYKKILVQLYRQKTSYNTVLFLLSAASFNKAYKRQVYLSQLEKRRHQQASLIRNTQDALKKQNSTLALQKKEKAALLEEELKQKGSLDGELEEKDKMVSSLKRKESQLKRDLTNKEKSKRQLNNKIENVIKNQIAAAKSTTRSYPGKENNTKPSNTYIPSSPYSKETAASFKDKKGRLSMPVSGGVIVGKFGKQQHPVFEQVFTHNNGIDIRCAAAASVKAVHDGIVVSVFSIPGSGNAVMLKHGNYYTTYSNLGTVSVKRGDKVGIGKKIGTVQKDSNTSSYLLHFELWNGKTKENPQHWLR
jgi:septal ring factor EnvC (AmiA/AmiB activator)